uniref:CSON006164 protein n=1 Tax=Culicoides sonorensis TaxID=179676 RepID=A0A336MT21_CULSO
MGFVTQQHSLILVSLKLKRKKQIKNSTTFLAIILDLDPFIKGLRDNVLDLRCELGHVVV